MHLWRSSGSNSLPLCWGHFPIPHTQTLYEKYSKVIKTDWCYHSKKNNFAYAVIHLHFIQWFSRFMLTAILSNINILFPQLFPNSNKLHKNYVIFFYLSIAFLHYPTFIQKIKVVYENTSLWVISRTLIQWCFAKNWSILILNRQHKDGLWCIKHYVYGYLKKQMKEHQTFLRHWRDLQNCSTLP